MPAYVPTDWIDLTTLVDAARLDNMESGIVAAERSENKGAANGYAPLDATSKVPAANLPAAGGGGGADYEGAWAVGTPYVQGDVVLYNGVEYLAVNPSTGQTPPTPAAPPAVLAIPLVTTLPGSPFDGQEVILTDSLTAPTYQWRLRYTASITDAYKWVFVGGSDARAEVATDETWTATGWQDVATVGPRVILPRAGFWAATGGAIFYSSAVESFLLCLFNGTASTLGFYQQVHQAGAGGQSPIAVSGAGGALAAGSDIRLRYQHTNGSATGHALMRWIAVRPVRIS